MAALEQLYAVARQGIDIDGQTRTENVGVSGLPVDASRSQRKPS